MDGIINVMKYLFSSKKKLVSTTFSQKEYYEIASRLSVAGVKYRVAVTTNRSSTVTHEWTQDTGSEYKFYVTKEDQNKAERAIHK